MLEAVKNSELTQTAAGTLIVEKDVLKPLASVLAS
jgi:hypothetical protein